MIVGKVYKFVDRNKKFPFGYRLGAFLGYTKEKWPIFMLDIERGTQCFVNAVDDTFEEIIFTPKDKQ